MDFRFTEEEENFRQELRQFLKQELPSDCPSREKDWELMSDADWAYAKEFCRKLAAKGWIGLAWPKEYGGQGRSHMFQVIFTEEVNYHRAPTRPTQYGLDRAGPSILFFGTEEQKRKYIGRIIKADIVFSQGFTEPNAGSDIASLQTRAVEDGDYYVVNGQKMFTSFAHYSDVILLPVKTDPEARHRGITYLLMDTKLPGVTIRPLIDMMGLHFINEIFLDDVRIPKSETLGEKNRGWYVMMTTLNFERSQIGRLMESYRPFEDLVKYATETKCNGQPLSNNPLIRHRLADLAVEFAVGRLLCYRVAWMQSKGLAPEHEVSVAKVLADELTQRVARAGIQLLGLYGQLRPDSKGARLQGRFERMYQGSVINTIAAGTVEIQRNIIALRGLGLPRG